MTAAPAIPEADRHPDLHLEQQYVTRSYQLLDKGLADVERTYASYQEGNRATAAALRRALDILRNSRGSGQLVFGRVDRNGEPRSASPSTRRSAICPSCFTEVPVSGNCAYCL